MITLARISYTRLQDEDSPGILDILTHSPEADGHKGMAEVYGPNGRCDIPMWWCSV